MDKSNLADLAVRGTEAAWALCQVEEGWSKSNWDMGEAAVLEWREGDPGLLETGAGLLERDVKWRCWRLTAAVDAPACLIKAIIMDVDRIQEWNPALKKTQVNLSLSH